MKNYKDWKKSLLKSYTETQEGTANESKVDTNHLYTLFLSGVISEDTYLENAQQANQPQQQQQQQTPQQPNQPQQQQAPQQPNQPQQQQTPQPTQAMQHQDINQVASQIQFQPTSKKKLMYKFVEDINNMPAVSYAVAQQQMPITTMTSDGKETQNTAESGDIVMSGPSGEKYVIKAAKFPKLYSGHIGGTIHPEQNPRNVGIYYGSAPITFTAPWGESMVLKPGDYLVKEDEGKFYRIAKKEYELTYNPPGKVG
jgi:hypothetical protein